jgi:hypothetical protein
MHGIHGIKIRQDAVHASFKVQQNSFNTAPMRPDRCWIIIYSDHQTQPLLNKVLTSNFLLLPCENVHLSVTFISSL